MNVQYLEHAGKHARTSSKRHWVTYLRPLLLLLAAAIFTFAAFETAPNPTSYEIRPECIAFSIGAIALFLAALYFLGQRCRIVPMLGVVALTILGIIEYFVLQFKGGPILPGDILAAGTALDVADEYTFVLPEHGYVAIGFGLAAILCLALMGKWPGSKREQPQRALVNVGIGLLISVVLAVLLVVEVGTNFLGIGINYFSAQKNYAEQGFIPTFIRAANDIRLVPPTGYSDEAAVELEAELASTYDDKVATNTTQQEVNAQFDEVKPSVVIIMNESYSDLSLFEELHDGYTGTYLTKETVPGALVQGWLTVPVIGGGTADVEFEMLTGVSMGLLGPGKHPYPQYNFETASNLARHFNDLGYHTSAMHAAAGSNYRRRAVYPQLGFNDTYFEGSFSGASRWHGWIDDGPTYDKILEILQDKSAPQFVFDVTVQNHGGYDKGNTPNEKPEGYTADWLDAKDNAKMNDFVACIERSDDYLKEFLAKVEQLDRPVVVLFFGDHQPRMAEYFNDDLFKDEDELEHFARITKVPYLMWANYDVAGHNRNEPKRFDTGASYLGPMFLQEFGAPLTNYHKALLAVSDDVPVVSSSSYRDAQWNLHAYGEETPEQEQLDKLSIMQFYEFP